MSKIKALSEFLGIDKEEAVKLIDEGDYLVLTDKEADKLAKEYILDSLWAFQYNFLTGHSKAIANIPQKDYEAMAGKLCESFNEAVRAMIDDYEGFVEDAISADGRGHFLGSYDGEENEQGGFYIYRIN